MILNSIRPKVPIYIEVLSVIAKFHTILETAEGGGGEILLKWIKMQQACGVRTTSCFVLAASTLVYSVTESVRRDTLGCAITPYKVRRADYKTGTENYKLLKLF